MRKFTYFLFENFDPAQEAGNPMNPRRILGSHTDAILSWIADFPAFFCSYSQACGKFGADAVASLVSGGVLRREEDALVFDTPVFLREDAALLQSMARREAAHLADCLEMRLPSIQFCAEALQNGFDAETNLYHILCGMIFDGGFFTYLSNRNAVSTSRPHASGLDYISVIYEDCPALQTLSDGLLCSYNRVSDGRCALQSFGDANGDRLDFYRFLRLRELGRLPEKYAEADRLWTGIGANQQTLLEQTADLIQNGACEAGYLSLLEMFGYARRGKVCVPVFEKEALPAIRELERLVEECLGDAMAEALRNMQKEERLTAVRHQVRREEISNELYHILFGTLNEELAARNLVAAPPHIPGAGRYLQCVELF